MRTIAARTEYLPSRSWRLGRYRPWTIRPGRQESCRRGPAGHKGGTHRKVPSVVEGRQIPRDDHDEWSRIAPDWRSDSGTHVHD